jgi:ribosomal protein S18 acetylase RimI-like enzyme
MFDPGTLPAELLAADEADARIEDAGLTSSQPPQQAIYDGWLLRYSPGKAKRARSVNAIGAGRVPLAAKLAAVEAFYRRIGLPCLYRITPYSLPAELDRSLQGAGYAAFDESRVMTLELATALPRPAGKDFIEEIAAGAFAEAAGDLRGSPPAVMAAERERIAGAALPGHYLILRREDRVLACGCIVLDGEYGGVFNMVTAAAERGRGHATTLLVRLLGHAVAAGAKVAYLQVDAGNAAARRVYTKFGFRDRYAYWYRARAEGREGS